MRTNINSFTICNVFGFGQDRVVSLWIDSCASAAQHLHKRHSSYRARERARALKRVTVVAAVTGAALKAMAMRLAITGPQWQPVRLTSPVLVTTA